MIEVNIQEQIPGIKLVNGQKDSYGWKIKLFGKDTNKVLDQIKQAKYEVEV